MAGIAHSCDSTAIYTDYAKPVIQPPTFASLEEYISRVNDVDFWAPYVTEILERHDLYDTSQEPEAGFNATYPTFLQGTVAVKIFGYAEAWSASHAAEHAALAEVATDPEIAAPRLLGEGRIADDPDAPWPYLITARVPGVALWSAKLTDTQWRAVAGELGRQVKRLHSLQPSTGVATDADWPANTASSAAKQSSLPRHLSTQADDFVSRFKPVDPVFTHADIVANHVFVESSHITGIIDWGDAMMADRHYELIQIYRDTFGCDKNLFKVFLEASDWPVNSDFPRRTMAFALRRQAIGIAQHRTIDVFEPIAALFPLADISTLDELAIELFTV